MLLTYVLGNPLHHGVVANAADLERYPWTAYPEILGLAAPGLVDVRAVLALLSPDEGAAREVLREALALRAARWSSRAIRRRSLRRSTGRRWGRDRAAAP